MRAELAEGDAVRNPIRETFFGCCASAMTATASSIAATKIDATQLSSLRTSFGGYHEGRNWKSIIY